jgi:hypothetical protein
LVGTGRLTVWEGLLALFIRRLLILRSLANEARCLGMLLSFLRVLFFHR